MTVVRRVGVGVLVGIVWLFVAIAALSAIGAYLPHVPVASEFGLMASLLGPTMTALLLLVVGYQGWRWSHRRRIGHALLGGAALLTALGLGLIVAAQVEAAKASGVTIDLPRALGLWFVPRHHDSPEPTEQVYLRTGGQDLHVLIYRPSAAPHASAPILVYVHGGAWQKFTQRFRSPDMRWFADQGFLVISVEYSLSDDGRHRWNVAQPQVGCALAWTAANARRLGADAGRLSMFGESAGGNLVLDTSYAASVGRLRPACPGALPRITAVVAAYPVVDVVGLYYNPEHGGSPEGTEAARAYTGGSPERYPNRYAFVSPNSYVSQKAPPTLFLLGAADTLVLPPATRALARRLAGMGVPSRTIEVPYAPHAYDVMPGGVANQLTRRAVLNFIASHGAASSR